MNQTQSFAKRKLAVLTLVAVFAAALVFHVLVVVGIVPYQIIWGGRLSSEEQMRVFEAVSISINSVFLLIALIEAGLMKVKFQASLSRWLFIVIGVVFLLNTVGNLLSVNAFEQTVFTILTAFISLLAFFIALKK